MNESKFRDEKRLLKKSSQLKSAKRASKSADSGLRKAVSQNQGKSTAKKLNFKMLNSNELGMHTRKHNLMQKVRMLSFNSYKNRKGSLAESLEEID